MMKKFITFVLGMVLMRFLVAQLPVFSKSTSTYTHLSGATRIAKDSVWDDFENWKMPLQKMGLGFTFHAFGHNIDTFLLRDGALVVNYGNSDTVIYIGSEFNTNDFCDKGLGTKTPKSPIWWKREGTAGDRILKIEWQNFGFYSDYIRNGSCTDSGNLQMWVYENGNKIEMRFGTNRIASFANSFPSGADFTCAKYDQWGRTSGIVLDGVASNPNSKSFADTSAHGLKSWPVNGQVYTFTFVGTLHSASPVSDAGLFYSADAIRSRQILQAEVEVFAADGRKVKSAALQDGRLEVADLAPGFYVARIRNNHQTAFLRFFKS